MNKVYAVVLAAGKGSRMGSKIPKQYLMLEDKPVLYYSLSAFDIAPSVDGLLVAAPVEYHEYIKNEIIDKYSIKKPVLFAEGGEERTISVYKALKALPSDAYISIIHDGVRPLITPDVIEQVIEATDKYGAAAAGMPAKDTIKLVDEDCFSVSTPDRSWLWLVQTPQAFKHDIILNAYEKAMMDSIIATDDTAIVERLGHCVKMIEGGYGNIKITTQEDIQIAESLLKGRRENA